MLSSNGVELYKVLLPHVRLVAPHFVNIFIFSSVTPPSTAIILFG
jgi:hypothetical protein